MGKHNNRINGKPFLDVIFPVLFFMFSGFTVSPRFPVFFRSLTTAAEYKLWYKKFATSPRSLVNFAWEVELVSESEKGRLITQYDTYLLLVIRKPVQKHTIFLKRRFTLFGVTVYLQRISEGNRKKRQKNKGKRVIEFFSTKRTANSRPLLFRPRLFFSLLWLFKVAPLEALQSQEGVRLIPQT